MDNLNVSLDRFGVTIDSISILALPLETKTQEALDRINASAANVKNAQLEYDRALKDEETANVRKRSGILSAEGNMRYCLEVMNAWNVERNGPLPAGWTCTSGSTAPVPTITLNK